MIGGTALPDTPLAVPPEVARCAVEWLVELASGVATDTTRRSHQAWLDEHPEHERAWRHIEVVNQRLRGAAGSPAFTASVVQAALAR